MQSFNEISEVGNLDFLSIRICMQRRGRVHGFASEVAEVAMIVVVMALVSRGD